MTPHNDAKIEDVANIVLMPGDPLRSKYISDNFLNNSKLINSVRNMYAYTGFYNGKRITVFPSGMGMPSIGIYSYELYRFYNVDKIIRLGSCGALTPQLNLFDTVLVDKSYTAGNFAKSLTGVENHVEGSSETLNELIKETALEKNVKLVEGNTCCSEIFDYYCDSNAFQVRLPNEMKIIASDMEAFALFSMAKFFKKEASCLLTVVDSQYTVNQVSAKDRETSLDSMVELALNTVLKI